MEIKRHSVQTPGEPAGVITHLATQGVDPVENDLVFVQAKIVDAKGVTVPVSGRHIRFSVAEDLEIIGTDLALSENGNAAILVKVNDIDGEHGVSARVE